MGLYSGAVSLARYRLIGDHTFGLAKLNKLILPHQLKKVVLSRSKKEERFGWVLPLHCSDIALENGYWDMTHCQVEGGYILRMRIERRKVSAELLQLLLREKLASYYRKYTKLPSRPKQREMREETQNELLEQALPTLSHVDAYWQDDGQILFFNTSRKNKELFEQLFKKTFADALQCQLMELHMPLLASSSEAWESTEDILKELDAAWDLVPSDFQLRADVD